MKVCVCSFGLFKTGSHSVAQVSLVLSWQSSCLSPGNAKGSLWWATTLGFCPGTGTVFLVVCESSLVTDYDHLSGWSSLGRGVVSSHRVKLTGLHVTSSSLSFSHWVIYSRIKSVFLKDAYKHESQLRGLEMRNLWHFLQRPLTYITIESCALKHSPVVRQVSGFPYVGLQCNPAITLRFILTDKSNQFWAFYMVWWEIMYLLYSECKCKSFSGL